MKTLKTLLTCAIYAGVVIDSYANVNLPKQREDVLASAQKILDNRGSVLIVDGLPIDPFIGRVVIAPVVETKIEEVVEDKSQIIVRLSDQIRASGTVIFDNNRFLLVGAKRYKAGDRISVDLDGERRDVSIAEITATTFTIDYGGLRHVRPIKR